MSDEREIRVLSATESFFFAVFVITGTCVGTTLALTLIG